MDGSNRIEDLLDRYSEEQILRAIVNSYKTIISEAETGNPQNQATVSQTMPVTKVAIKTSEPSATSDHPPCSNCGGSFFLRTGTCHVCQTCGTSQGCS